MVRVMVEVKWVAWVAAVGKGGGASNHRVYGNAARAVARAQRGGICSGKRP